MIIAIIIIGITMGIQSQQVDPEQFKCFDKPKCDTHIHRKER